MLSQEDVPLNLQIQMPKVVYSFSALPFVNYGYGESKMTLLNAKFRMKRIIKKHEESPELAFRSKTSLGVTENSSKLEFLVLKMK
jgi:hypothetical protein